MVSIRTVLSSKNDRTNVTVEASATMLDAVKAMSDANIGAVLVTENGKVVGIFTERDYVRKGELAGRVAATTPVRDVMVAQMITVTWETTVDQCLALMKQNRIRHLPVVENDQLLGIISMRDVMFASIANRESEIRGLENYITGTGFQS